MQCYLIIRYSFFVEKFRKFVRNVLQKFVAEIRLSLFSLYPVPLSIFFNMNDTVFASKSEKYYKYGVFSGPYFPEFGLDTEIYGVNFRIQSEYRKIWTRSNSVFGHFSRSERSPKSQCVTQRIKFFIKDFFRKYGSNFNANVNPNFLCSDASLHLGQVLK